MSTETRDRPRAKKARQATKLRPVLSSALSGTLIKNSGDGLIFRMSDGSILTIDFTNNLAQILTKKHELLQVEPSLEIFYELLRETSRRAAGDNPSASELTVADDLKALKGIFERLPVRKEKATALLAAIESEVENAERPTWKPPAKKPDPFPHLRGLTAPLFIKEVWKNQIHHGEIPRELIASYDKDLLQAYNNYVSSRRARGADLGDAKGLTLVRSRKSRKTLSP